MANCRACLNEVSENLAYCDNICRYHKLPFRAWDGEGYTKPGTLIHVYNVLATNNEEPLVKQEGITTLEAFEYLTKKREKCINVWFAFDYDVNCILKDIPLKPYLEELAKDGKTQWRGWKIKYIPSKIFSIKRGTKRFSSFDTFGFFQKSFLRACKSFHLDTTSIEKGKESRAEFYKWDIKDVIAYNNEELRLLVELMAILRKRLKYHAPLSQWYGPGAVSSQWLDKVVRLEPEKHRTWIPEMMEAIMHSYFGGRIDVATIGEMNLYAYDIASAYPAAMCEIHEIDAFARSKELSPGEPMALYRVRWDVKRTSKWGPFPWRSHEGQILYPNSGESWYYGCEVESALRIFPTQIVVLDGWIPIYNSPRKYPLLKHIQFAYDQRAELKRKGDPSELAYKLILNSMYGKFAQKRTSNNEPRFQNYLWAGFITAYTRSLILDVIRRDPASVIAIATDSIFSTKPILPLSENGKLGSWQYEGNSPTLLVMPGVYARILEGEVKKYRQRGFPLPINYGYLLRLWGCDTDLNTPGTEETFVVLKKFVTFRHAVAQNRKHWCYFEEEERGLQNVALTGFSKRFPNPLQILDEKWKTRDMFTVPSPPAERYSHEYTIPTFEDEVERDELELL